ncbi:Anaphase-promoting complex subunit 11 [Operophtera brumata]|uniref:Anaphase-promoting complex subunit 11 n=1 Tax=Operophtera brumata TaxID=104452 RepID=A0A0L7K3L0_OPEBR|nr:Anaphase-promoting complex subunit 11 [Operophtera brumata]
MKVTVKSWTGVATWRWVANDDNCGICRMPFDSCCPDCKLPGDDCPLYCTSDGSFSMLMVQSNAQPMKSNKLKGPPPVPPRPNQSVVAEALAKTRKAVADSKANFTKSRAFSKREQTTTSRSKTLERANTANPTLVSPKQNGLARVKSFIRDVISDRSSSRNNNNKDEANIVIDKGKGSENMNNGDDIPEHLMMKDMNNHEMLIYELQTMRSQSNVPESLDIKECEDINGQCDSEDSEPNYAVSSVTSGNTDDGYDQAYAYILDVDLKSR